ncbi:MAG: glycosyltransferase family 4 protein [Ardenticatenaceae bacterium]
MSKFTKIAVDGTAALAQGGGIGRFTHGLIQGLASVDHETQYTICYAKDATKIPPFDLPANFRWQRLGLTQKQAIWLWHRLHLPLPIDLWLGRPTLYHSPDYTLPPLARARGIVTIHDLSFETLPEVHEPKLRRYLQSAVPYSIKRATHVFADSESTRQDIIDYYNTEPAKITVVYPGVEPRFRPFKANLPADGAALHQVRSTYDLERPFILIVGTLEPRKNMATLIRAFARYRRQGKNELQLVIAGGGGWLSERETLQKLVVELALTDDVYFTGFVPDEQLPALINLAQAMVYPSLYEGFGLPVLEALACGVPVITARNSSLTEAGGHAAHYIDNARDADALAHALTDVLHDQAKRQHMIAKGLDHAKKFTWESTGRQVVGLYKQVLGKGS